jgi:hypothetical protein
VNVSYDVVVASAATYLALVEQRTRRRRQVRNRGKHR